MKMNHRVAAGGNGEAPTTPDSGATVSCGRPAPFRIKAAKIEVSWILVLLLFSFSKPLAFTAQPSISDCSVSGTTVSITTSGSPGDLQFLIRNYELPASNADNAILIAVVGTNGLAHFTTELTSDISFFRARTVSDPVILGTGTNQIEVISSPEDLVLTNSGTAMFMVEARGSVSNLLQYQWYRDDAVIPGATESTYSFSAGLVDNGSSFSCDVNMVGHSPVRIRTSKYGSPDARLFVVTTNPPPLTPTIVGDGPHAIRVFLFPHDTVVTNTGIATFKVNAEGINTNLTLQYQWFWNEIPIPVASNSTAASSTLVITNAHFDPGSTSLTPPVAYSRNTDVGFYSCNVNMVGHPPVRVRSGNTNATGALLSLFVGSNTTLYSAYEVSSSSSSCLSTYSGKVYFRNNEPGDYYNTLLFPSPFRRTGCSISDASSVSVPAGTAYSRTIYFYSSAMDSCRSPWGPLTTGTSTTSFTYTGAPGPTFRFSIYVHTPSPFPTGAQFALNKTWTGP
ncbi:MAG: hypothetical protein ACXW32_06120 [Limisphaerales bacterium]